MFMSLAVKSFKVFPKHNEYGFISELFTLIWNVFVASTNKKLLLALQWRLKHNFLWSLKKLIIRYSTSAVIVVSFNPCGGPLPRSNMSFLLLSIRTNKLLSTPKIATFLPQVKFGTEKS